MSDEETTCLDCFHFKICRLAGDVQKTLALGEEAFRSGDSALARCETYRVLAKHCLHHVSKKKITDAMRE